MPPPIITNTGASDSCVEIAFGTMIILQINNLSNLLDVKLPGGVENDHFAHCYISCRLAQECGVRTSLLIGWLREELTGGYDTDGEEDMQANMDGVNIARKTRSTNDGCKKAKKGPKKVCEEGCESAYGDSGNMLLP